MVKAGCHIIRVAVPTINDAENLKNIKKKLLNRGIDVPIVADVHFLPEVAERAAQYVEKVRINPGNYLSDKPIQHYSDEDFNNARQQIANNIQPLLATCKNYHTALRVGVNWGSLSKRILYRYGNTAKGMVESALEFIEILLESGFEQFTLSLKASDVRIMQQANIMLVKEMIERNTFFPLHLGVTEAGAGIDARIKSAAGIGSLLKLGIGDTIRVSLTEAPEAEIPVAKKIVPYAYKRSVVFNNLKKISFHSEPIDEDVINIVHHSKPMVASNVRSIEADLYYSRNRLRYAVTKEKVPIDQSRLLIVESDEKNFERFLIRTTIYVAKKFLTGNPWVILLRNPNFNTSGLVQLSFDILQGLGLRYSKTEYVACPGCGRTQFNITRQLKQVQEKTAQYKALKIAVMGCIINGPGEMAGADYGYVGSTKGKVTLYNAGKVYIRNIPEETAPDVLKDMIEHDLIKVQQQINNRDNDSGNNKP